MINEFRLLLIDDNFLFFYIDFFFLCLVFIVVYFFLLLLFELFLDFVIDIVGCVIVFDMVVDFWRWFGVMGMCGVGMWEIGW